MAAQTFTGQSAPAGDIVTSNLGTHPPFTGVNINALIGANRFYAAGFTGTNSVIANVEAGLIWSGHSGLSKVTHTIFATSAGAGPQTGEVDWHATAVGMVLAGQPARPGQDYRTGIAYGANLWSGAIATQWSGTRLATSFNLNGDTYLTPYNTVFATGINGRTADVVNSSWGFTDPGSSSGMAAALDAFAFQNPSTTLVCAAGNAGPSANSVIAPGSGYNGITVGALTAESSTPPYSGVASFSSRGPNAYYDPVNGMVSGQRAVVDIVAPGTELTSAYYGGPTGGNGSSPLLSGPAWPDIGSNGYLYNLAGTSFSAPIVAGGAALLTDAAYVRFAGDPNARDARVVKAVLLNSADKMPGWNNGQVLNNGIITTHQALDWSTGAGRVNLFRAFDQYLGGTTDVAGLGGGVVGTKGWDYGLVTRGGFNDYYINAELLHGTDFTTTLAWFRDRENDVANQLVYDLSFDNLDLQVWRLVDGVPGYLVAESDAPYDSVQHLYFTVAQDGYYAIRVNWGQNLFDLGGVGGQDYYGLAWDTTAATAAPEPATLFTALGALGLLCGYVVKGLNRSR